MLVGVSAPSTPVGAIVECVLRWKLAATFGSTERDCSSQSYFEPERGAGAAGRLGHGVVRLAERDRLRVLLDFAALRHRLLDLAATAHGAHARHGRGRERLGVDLELAAVPLDDEVGMLFPEDLPAHQSASR
jgi:hypothetical protein